MRYLTMMRPEERLGLARQAYLRALARTRAHSTPWSWLRLLTAARNVGSATRDRDQARPTPAGATTARPSPGRDDAAPRRRLPEVRRPEQPSPLLGAAAAAPAPRPAVSLGRWSELTQEWERSRRLREQARMLVKESCALCAAVAALARAWPCPAPDGAPGRG